MAVVVVIAIIVVDVGVAGVAGFRLNWQHVGICIKKKKNKKICIPHSGEQQQDGGANNWRRSEGAAAARDADQMTGLINYYRFIYIVFTCKQKQKSKSQWEIK